MTKFMILDDKGYDNGNDKDSKNDKYKNEEDRNDSNEKIFPENEN